MVQLDGPAILVVPRCKIASLDITCKLLKEAPCLTDYVLR